MEEGLRKKSPINDDEFILVQTLDLTVYEAMEIVQKEMIVEKEATKLSENDLL